MKVDRNLKQAKERGIAVCRHPKYGEDLYNQWYRYCKSEGLPFVVIIPLRKYAAVIIDSYSTGSGYAKSLPLSYEEMKEVDNDYSNKIESFVEDLVEVHPERIKEDSLFGAGVYSNITVKAEFALEVADKFRSIWFASYGKVKGL